MTRTERFKLLRDLISIESEEIASELEDLKEENKVLKAEIARLKKGNKSETVKDTLSDMSMSDLVGIIFDTDFYKESK